MSYPDYKRVKVLMAHCPTCGEMLRGNNSSFSPWRCSCGIWKWDGNWEGMTNFEIVKEEELKT